MKSRNSRLRRRRYCLSHTNSADAQGGGRAFASPARLGPCSHRPDARRATARSSGCSRRWGFAQFCQDTSFSCFVIARCYSGTEIIAETIRSFRGKACAPFADARRACPQTLGNFFVGQSIGGEKNHLSPLSITRLGPGRPSKSLKFTAPLGG